MKVIERFEQYIKEKAISLNSIDVKLGLSNGYIGKQIKNKASIGSDILQKIISEYTDLNLVWLLTGQGDMILEEGYLNTVINVGGERRVLMYKNNNESNVLAEPQEIYNTKYEAEFNRIIEQLNELKAKILNDKKLKK